MSWTEWFNGILGLWVILASYLYVPSGGAQVAMFVTGIVIAVLGFWGGATEPHNDYTSHQVRS